MYETIFKEVEKQAYFAKHQKVLIAVSGGVDSMNLLHFLYLYQEKLEIEIAIAHINHKQRPESDDEEIYLHDWAQQHDIPIYISYFSGAFSEKAARDFRYAFFKKIMTEKNYTALVTAHHADDQAETVFMRLLRGSRLRHLSGIQTVQPFANGEIIRPFLPFSKVTLPAIFHFEDRSNHSSTYLRNRVRNTYLSELSQENPKFKASLRELARESQLVFQALEDLTADLETTDCQIFLSQTPAVQEILLQNYLEEFPQLQLNKQQFQEMLQLIRKKANMTYHIKGDYFLLKDYQSFGIQKISPKTDRENHVKVLEYGNIVRYGQYQFAFHEISCSNTLEIDLISQSPILLRRRLAGDVIDFGKFSKKLRRLFIDDKISAQDRQEAIIGEQEGKIIFVLAGGKTYLRKASKRDIMGPKLYIEKLDG